MLFANKYTKTSILSGFTKVYKSVYMCIMVAIPMPMGVGDIALRLQGKNRLQCFTVIPLRIRVESLGSTV